MKNKTENKIINTMKSIALSILIVFLLILNCNKLDAGNKDSKPKDNSSQVVKNSNQAAKLNSDSNASQKQQESLNTSGTNSKSVILPRIVIEGVF